MAGYVNKELRESLRTLETLMAGIKDCCEDITLTINNYGEKFDEDYLRELVAKQIIIMNRLSETLDMSNKGLMTVEEVISVYSEVYTELNHLDLEVNKIYLSA